MRAKITLTASALAMLTLILVALAACAAPAGTPSLETCVGLNGDGYVCQLSLGDNIFDDEGELLGEVTKTGTYCRVGTITIGREVYSKVLVGNFYDQPGNFLVTRCWQATSAQRITPTRPPPTTVTFQPTATPEWLRATEEGGGEPTEATSAAEHAAGCFAGGFIGLVLLGLFALLGGARRVWG